VDTARSAALSASAVSCVRAAVSGGVRSERLSSWEVMRNRRTYGGLHEWFPVVVGAC